MKKTLTINKLKKSYKTPDNQIEYNRLSHIKVLKSNNPFVMLCSHK